MHTFSIFLVYCFFKLGYSNLLELVVAEGPIETNYCNDSTLLEEAGLVRATLGQFLGYDCSEEFYHCRWQSDGFRTYRKKCKPGLVYDVHGTQNCNYDYNVKSCGIRSVSGPVQCNGTDFHCSLSEQCVPMSSRCDGHYDCGMEEDEQNCPLCTAGEFACKVSEQCISLDRRCNGLIECDDGTDERDCDICGHGLFHCGKSNECVSMEERCDGKRQCPHGEDEMLCKKAGNDKKYTCQSRDTEILMSQVCDGVVQCPDGSDEAYCEIPQGPSSAITFSKPTSAAVPYQPVPSQSLSKVEEVEQEEEGEDYDYEEIKNENAQFPMLSLVNLPTTTKAPITTTTTMRTTQRVATRITKPTFSRPRPRVNNVMESTKTTPKHKIVQPTFVKVSSTPKTETLAPRQTPNKSSGQRTRVIPKSASPSSLSMPTTKSSAAASEKVFLMQVTSPPVARPSQDMLKEITSQLNGGMSPELLAKIESIIKSEMKPARFRRGP
ncbi:unnamed protein product [Caenorhabditis angaria]|uniref:Chitin-binding type-2 domain-containing protein n=1 Tax=Caenorhabditis angaria TaxID=860376 RepID=A0A9P1ITW9_9PELO|nr:unnamed protein product [Caenorhabditis angaria]